MNVRFLQKLANNCYEPINWTVNDSVTTLSEEGLSRTISSSQCGILSFMFGIQRRSLSGGNKSRCNKKKFFFLNKIPMRWLLKWNDKTGEVKLTKLKAAERFIVLIRQCTKSTTYARISMILQWIIHNNEQSPIKWFTYDAKRQSSWLHSSHLLPFIHRMFQCWTIS